MRERGWIRSHLRARLSFATVVSSTAVVVALCGTAFASGVLPSRSVGTRQLKADAVTSGKVKDRSLTAADVARGQARRGANGPAGEIGRQGAAGAVDTSGLSTKAAAGARFLGRGLITVVGKGPDLGYRNAEFLMLKCPAGYAVISGGVEPQNVLFSSLPILTPTIDGQDLYNAPDGQHTAPDGWGATVLSTVLGVSTFRLAVVCAPLG